MTDSTEKQTTSCTAEEVSNSKDLSTAQRARIERNRQKALLLRQSRLATRPYPVNKDDRKEFKSRVSGKVVDTGGGFLLEEDEDVELRKKRPIVHPPGAMLGPDTLICEECDKDFMDSYLYKTFSHSVCDSCRDNEEKHRLISKTEAKSTYLLKDVDFDKRDPPLKCIIRKNPMNPRWGDMKLYLECQVAERSLDIWESEEKIEEEKERRTSNKEQVKQKKFDKRVKDLRMAVRSSLWKKDTSSHEHEYGSETYNEESDEYSKTCQTCGHTMSYEKM